MLAWLSSPRSQDRGSALGIEPDATTRSSPVPTAAARWILAALIALGGPNWVAGTGEGPEPRLESLLQRLDKVAALYRDTALRFSCKERIVYHPGTPYPRAYDLEYMYVFDGERGLRDHRTWLRKGKDRPPRPVDLAELDLPSVVLRAYSMVFVFQGSKRHAYRHLIDKEARALGRDAVVVRFEAIPPYREDYNDWFGRAWVDIGTSQLLRVEAMKAEQHEVKQRLESDLAGRTSTSDRPEQGYVIETVLTEFGVEHNGMRFPSRVEIVRARFEVRERGGVRTSKEHRMFRVEQEYSNYRFYGVTAYERSAGQAVRP